jgi:hypothetical protein
LNDVTVAAEQWLAAYDGAMEDEQTRREQDATPQDLEEKRRAADEAARQKPDDPVDDASDDSFPASDPPSFTGSTTD